MARAGQVVRNLLEIRISRRIDAQGRSERGLSEAAHKAGVPFTVNRVGSMFTFFFTEQPVTDYESAKRSDTERFGRFFRLMLDRGIYLAPSQFEAAFLSAAHSEADIDATLEAAAECFELSVH